jgi:ABC-2 type transport system permease protein
MNKILLIVQREYLTRVRKKTFIIMSLLSPLLISALWIVPIWLATMDGEKKEIQIIDASGLFENKIKNTDEISFDYTVIDENTKIEGLKSDDYYAALYIPKLDLDKPDGILLFSDKTVPFHITNKLSKSIAKEIEDIKLLRLNIHQSTLDSIETKISIQSISNKEGEKQTNAEVAFGVGYVSSFLIYFFIFFFGTQVMQGVMEEKTNRIIEVIISSVKPFELMLGKIIGIAGVALTQILIWGVIIILLSSFAPLLIDTNTTADTSQELSGKGQEMQLVFDAFATLNIPLLVGTFIFYFIGGYLLYAAMFGAVGAVSDNQTDSRQFMMPITMPLIFAIMIATFVVKNPDGSLAFWASIIPLTSPVIMMVRIPFGVPIWEIALSIFLLIISFISMTWVAARIYRIGILMYGKKVTFKELAKWAFKGDV